MPVVGDEFTEPQMGLTMGEEVMLEADDTGEGRKAPVDFVADRFAERAGGFDEGVEFLVVIGQFDAVAEVVVQVRELAAIFFPVIRSL